MPGKKRQRTTTTAQSTNNEQHHKNVMIWVVEQQKTIRNGLVLDAVKCLHPSILHDGTHMYMTCSSMNGTRKTFPLTIHQRHHTHTHKRTRTLHSYTGTCWENYSVFSGRVEYLTSKPHTRTHITQQHQMNTFSSLY